MNMNEAVQLHELLAKLQEVRRATLLPSGEQETDSHHSFSLALIAYDICDKQCPELNKEKILLFALVHDLLEIVTGDEDTLHYTSKDYKEKQKREENAKKEFNKLFEQYPVLRNAVDEYERLDTAEAAAIFVLDKACTTWTHHHDKGMYARTTRNLKTRADIKEWASRIREKVQQRVKTDIPQPFVEVLDKSFEALEGLF